MVCPRRKCPGAPRRERHPRRPRRTSSTRVEDACPRPLLGYVRPTSLRWGYVRWAMSGPPLVGYVTPHNLKVEALLKEMEVLRAHDLKVMEVLRVLKALSPPSPPPQGHVAPQ